MRYFGLYANTSVSNSNVECKKRCIKKDERNEENRKSCGLGDAGELDVATTSPSNK